MSEMEKKICLGCMQEINADDVMCPHCGFDPNNYRVNPRCLRLGTKLAGKYIIGKVIGEGGFGITYIGWDEKLELPIAIKEFFPPKIASRDTTREIIQFMYLMELRKKVLKTACVVVLKRQEVCLNSKLTKALFRYVIFLMRIRRHISLWNM